MGVGIFQNGMEGSSCNLTSSLAYLLSITPVSFAVPADRRSRSARRNVLAKPLIKMLLHEVVVRQMRIGSVDTINFLGLSRRKIFIRVKAPAALKQPLASQNFMNTRNTAVKIVRWIEERGI